MLPGERGADEGFGKRAGAGEEGRFVDEAVDDGVDEAYLAAVFVAPQLLHQFVFVRRNRVFGGEGLAVVFFWRSAGVEAGVDAGVARQLRGGVVARLDESDEVGALGEVGGGGFLPAVDAVGEGHGFFGFRYGFARTGGRGFCGYGLPRCGLRPAGEGD